MPWSINLRRDFSEEDFKCAQGKNADQMNRGQDVDEGYVIVTCVKISVLHRGEYVITICHY